MKIGEICKVAQNGEIRRNMWELENVRLGASAPERWETVLKRKNYHLQHSSRLKCVKLHIYTDNCIKSNIFNICDMKTLST